VCQHFIMMGGISFCELEVVVDPRNHSIMFAVLHCGVLNVRLDGCNGWIVDCLRLSVPNNEFFLPNPFQGYQLF
jgi:hypothetical protein